MQTFMKSCDVLFFFCTHNTQYSLLLLIHVQVQCDLAITRFTYVIVCSLHYLELFLKYKIGQTCLVCVCVCVCVFLGSMCLILFLRDNFESLKCCLNPWLSCMLNCIHIYVFPILKNSFKAISTHPQYLAYLSSSSIAFYHNLDNSRSLGGLIEKVSIPLISPRQILDPSSFLLPRTHA